MLGIRRTVLSTLALAAGSALALAAPSAASAAPNPKALPQYVIHFRAIVLPPSTTTGLQFHSTSCAIGPTSNPIVVTCQESGTIKFAATGGSGTATVSSALAGIDWKFSLVRSSASANTYRMVGSGTESVGTSPVRLPVRVTGTITVEPTPLPTITGTEDVTPLLPPAA
jgi:hypothetical protein